MVIQPTITASVGIAHYLKRTIPEKDIGTAAEGDIKYKTKYYMLVTQKQRLLYTVQLDI